MRLVTELKFERRGPPSSTFPPDKDPRLYQVRRPCFSPIRLEDNSYIARILKVSARCKLTQHTRAEDNLPDEVLANVLHTLKSSVGISRN